MIVCWLLRLDLINLRRQHPTSADNATLLAFAAERRAAATDRYRLPAAAACSGQ